MKQVLMICHGNICRSTMAEFVLKEMVRKQGLQAEYHVESAATSREEIGSDVHPGTQAKLTEQGIPFTRRKARQVTRADYETFDYLICMDSQNLRNLQRIIGADTQHKVSRLLQFAGFEQDIADPWYTGNFDVTYRDVVQGCEGFLAQTSGKKIK